MNNAADILCNLSKKRKAENEPELHFDELTNVPNTFYNGIYDPVVAKHKKYNSPEIPKESIYEMIAEFNCRNISEPQVIPVNDSIINSFTIKCMKESKSEIDAFYCKENKWWVSSVPCNISGLKELPATAPLPNVPKSDYLKYKKIYIAEPGGEWETYLFRKDVAQKIKEKEKNKDLRKLAKKSIIYNSFHRHMKGIYKYLYPTISFKLICAVFPELSTTYSVCLIRENNIPEIVKKYL